VLFYKVLWHFMKSAFAALFEKCFCDTFIKSIYYIMSGRKEQKAAELRAKAEAAEIEMNLLLQKSVDDLKKTRARRERKERGEPPSHEEVEEEIAEEKRQKEKSRTVFGKIKSVFRRRRSKSRSRSPPPGYAPPAYSRDATIGGTRRGKKNRKYKKTRRYRKRL